MPARPPLHALHVFCACVQAGGFRQAAQQLCVTPGAVSRQIQALEAQLGYPLFERGAGAQGMPTPAGRLLHGRVAGSMAAIAAALEASQAPRHKTLRVDTSVTLAMHWLIPRLRCFHERHPGLRVQVGTTEGGIHPGALAHVFIRRDPAELRGLPSEVLMAERSVLVASPALLPPAAEGQAARRAWLRAVPRLGAASRPDLWNRCGELQGLRGLALPPTLLFDNTVLAIQAAAQGLGVGLLPELFVQALLDSGTLRRVHPQRLDTGSYSFAVAPGRASPRVAAFVDWLREGLG